MLIFGLCKSCWCLKCLVSCFKYFHLKRARRSLAPVCLFPRDSASTGKSRSKILSVLCPKPRCIDTVPLEITVVCLRSVQWEDTTAENHTMLLVVLTANPHSNNRKKKQILIIITCASSTPSVTKLFII